MWRKVIVAAARLSGKQADSCFIHVLPRSTRLPLRRRVRNAPCKPFSRECSLREAHPMDEHDQGLADVPRIREPVMLLTRLTTHFFQAN